jgi:hypothetical protein
MLGARKLWATGGTAASQAAFDRFTAMVVASSRVEPAGALVDGGIENDSAMLVCESVEVALRIAQRLFLRAFDLGRRPDDARLWLRGCVVPFVGNARLRGQAQLSHPLENVSVFTYAPCALDAISIEKSGFKGMRLTLRSEVVTAELRRSLRIPFDGHSFIPLRKLGHSGYPTIVQGELLDYLWMATGDDHEWRDRSLQMAGRLRFAGKDPEEFIQAAATQVVFHECAAICQSVRSRANRARPS